MKSLILAALLLVALAGPASAFNCTAAGCTFSAVYKEPSTLVGGAPLTDLANDVVTYTVTKDGGAPGPVVTVTIPASKPTGGGNITFPISDGTLLPGHVYVIAGTVVANRLPTANAAPSAALTMQSLTMDLTASVPANPPVGGSFQ